METLERLSRLSNPLHLGCDSRIDAIGAESAQNGRGRCPDCGAVGGRLLKQLNLEGPADYGAELDSCGRMITDHFSMPA